MTTRTALFALLAMWGVGTAGCLPVVAEEAGSAGDDALTDTDHPGFTNRVWTRAAGEDELPGVMRVFLSDGTLVQDSCWETYRLSAWSFTSETGLTWNEDGVDIAAEIVSVTDAELTLSLQLRGGAVVETYVAADVPYVCPDLPR